MDSEYKANFLWPHEAGSLEQIVYELLNGKTEEYRKHWWGILQEHFRTDLADLTALAKPFRGCVNKKHYLYHKEKIKPCGACPNCKLDAKLKTLGASNSKEKNNGTKEV